MTLSGAKCSTTVNMYVKVPHPIMVVLGSVVAGSSGHSVPECSGYGRG
jgi:hypothetical protein